MTRYRLALAAVAVFIVAAVLFTVVRMPAPPATASTTGGQVQPVGRLAGLDRGQVRAGFDRTAEFDRHGVLLGSFSRSEACPLPGKFGHA